MPPSGKSVEEPSGPELDATDRHIIQALQVDGRMTNRDLARLVSLSPSSCLQRVRSLQERGVILGYHAQISMQALHREQEAVVAVRFRPHSRAVIDAFEKYVIALPETISFAHAAGNEDVLVTVAVPDVTELRQFILDKITVRREVVSVNTIVLFNQIRKTILEPLDGLH